MNISGNECGTNQKGFWLYMGESKKGEIIYIGTTTQKPSDRFRWHKHNHKNFKFSVLHNCKTSDEMFNQELSLINHLQPQFNKKKSKHNLNKRLSKSELEARKGCDEWCQSCLKRRVNKGYMFCMWCCKKGSTA